MLIDPSMVHSDAEAIEHVITPEIEFQLTKELGDPDIDPHDSEIPKIRI
jgi:manganese/zinc/iron transport system permease protein